MYNTTGWYGNGYYSTCPGCGRCNHCGRGGFYTPMYPYWYETITSTTWPETITSTTEKLDPLTIEKIEEMITNFNRKKENGNP